MKIAAAIAFICFMGVSVYVLLNEKNMSHPHAKVNGFKPTSPSKKIGEKKRFDLPPYELQRQRIDATTVYKFESKNNDDQYELNEDELQDFINSVKKPGQEDLHGQPFDVNNLNYYGNKNDYQYNDD